MSSEKVRFIREVVIRYVEQRRRAPRSMTQPAQVAAYLRRRVRDDAREHLVAIYLDARLRPIGDAILSIGTAKSTVAQPREVFQMAVALGACALPRGPRHPSGDVRPSDRPRGHAQARLRRAAPRDRAARSSRLGSRGSVPLDRPDVPRGVPGRGLRSP